MDMSDILTRVKLKLGLMAIATPFENLDDTITQIIEEITVPDFSIYQPLKETIHLKTSDLTLVERKENERLYLLPNWKNRKLIYVFNVSYDESALNGFGYYGDIMPQLSGNLFAQALMSNAAKKLTETVIPKMTFRYEGQRKLRVYNMYASSQLTLRLGFEHDKSLASIEEAARLSFLQLALLDVKENLYPTMKMYSDLNTVHGNINLHLNDWENAEQEKKELLTKWDELYHLDLDDSMYYY